MDKTIFEKIAQKEISAYIVDENDEFMAFLDAFPAHYGQTLVIPKVQKDSYVFKHDAEFMARYWAYVKKIALLLDEKLHTLRTVLMFEGFEVNHLHAKLYPMRSIDEAAKFSHHAKYELKEEDGKEIMLALNS